MVARMTAGLARTFVYLSAGEGHSEHHGHRTSVSSVRSLGCPCEAGNAFLWVFGAVGRIYRERQEWRVAIRIGVLRNLADGLLTKSVHVGCVKKVRLTPQSRQEKAR